MVGVTYKNICNVASDLNINVKQHRVTGKLMRHQTLLCICKVDESAAGLV